MAAGPWSSRRRPSVDGVEPGRIELLDPDPDPDPDPEPAVAAVSEPGGRPGMPGLLAVLVLTAAIVAGLSLAMPARPSLSSEALPGSGRAAPSTSDGYPANRHGSVDVAGHLPDGTDFVVRQRGRTADRVVEVRVDLAPLGIDREQEPAPMYTVVFTLTGSGRPISLDVAPSGPGLDWRVSIEALGDAPKPYGSGLVALIDSLRPSIASGMPLLDPLPPFELVAGSAQARYETFSVREGCADDPQWLCSETAALEVSRRDRRGPVAISSGATAFGRSSVSGSSVTRGLGPISD